MTSLIGLMYKVRSIQQAETKHFSSTIHVDTGQTSSPNTQNSPSTTRDGHISTQSTFNTNSSGVNYLTIARNPSLMTISTVMSFLFALIMHLRILIGRKQFPCFLYKLVYHLAVPSMSTTIILRTMRVAMLGLLNRLKEHLSDPPQVMNGIVIDIHSVSHPNDHTSPNSSPSSSYPLSHLNSSTTFTAVERKSQNEEFFFRTVNNMSTVQIANKICPSLLFGNNFHASFSLSYYWKH
ncbi:hypothetical protein FDP41_004374 [Naegleria fowleri]|uniref:Uncharacterized protein n=1 Tax=Naegleria fowleri TaxID=5763 RepID=A0A6A5BSV5_NAEFO|nr:uncharacterized protein FDP41_004374 [Naegleria fowleri]KAF0976475.1 hypothetical protein FDP41_004374 [Naegleria fowleri]